MNRRAAATALALVAVDTGEDISSAIDRAASAFGGVRRLRIEEAVERAVLEAVSAHSKLEIELLRLRARTRRPSSMFYAVSVALGVTLAAFAMVIPSSAAVGLAGW